MVNINYYKWDETHRDEKNTIISPAPPAVDKIRERIKPVLADVRFNGDGALCMYAAKYDRTDLNADQLRITDEELQNAADQIAPELKDNIDRKTRFFKDYFTGQMEHMTRHRTENEYLQPLDKAGLYLSGQCSPASISALCTAATAAGVDNITLTMPPEPMGHIDPARLYAVQASGLKPSGIIKAGGAQAIAALAYGTQTVPKVDKIVGPGGPYTTAAKHMLAHMLMTDGHFGPYHSLYLCDGSTDTDRIMSNLIHAAKQDFCVKLYIVTHDEPKAIDLYTRLPQALGRLSEEDKSRIKPLARGGIILTKTAAQTIELCRKYAPARAYLCGPEMTECAEELPHTPELIISVRDDPLVNILPAAGLGRGGSALSVQAFLTRQMRYGRGHE